MQEFTGVQYLMIDAANQIPGLDKKLFEERIEWTKANLHHLESCIDQVKPKKKPLFAKACLNIRRAQAGKAIGAMVALDASCSGVQIMSAMTGCVVGATNTGLVDPTKPMDAYGICTEYMNQDLNGFSIERDLAKDAFMTTMYGSSEKPKQIFGKDTPELSAFYGAAEKTAPGAWQLLQELLGAWQSYAEVHEWELPDGFLARVRVKEKVETRITVDELEKASFTYQYSDYVGTKSGISLPANSVHSVDSYVVRCMQRRCNYDAAMVQRAYISINKAINDIQNYEYEPLMVRTQRYIDLYNRTGMADVVILPYLTDAQAWYLSKEHLVALQKIVQSMLVHQPFPVVTVHDAFAAHVNNLNHVRQHYINILAEIAESTMLQDILNQITGTPDGIYEKHSTNLGQLIRQSNYAIS